MFTRTEVSQLLDIDLKNIPYLISSLGIEPIRMGKKHSNTFYDGIQILKMKLAIYFKKLGLSYEFTKRYIEAVEKQYGTFVLKGDMWVSFKDISRYIEDVTRYPMFNIFHRLDPNRIQFDYRTNEDGDLMEVKDYYLILNSEDMKKICVELIDGCERLDIETIKPPDIKLVKKELLENAEQHGIDVRKVEAFLNQAA